VTPEKKEIPMPAYDFNVHVETIGDSFSAEDIAAALTGVKIKAPDFVNTDRNAVVMAVSYSAHDHGKKKNK